MRRYAGLEAVDEALVSHTDRTYDLAGRSNVLDHLSKTDELLAGYNYDYDFSGLLTGESRSNQDPAFAQDIEYRYDLTGQLIDALFDERVQPQEHFEYDANGNRLFVRNGEVEQTYGDPGPANRLKSDGQYRYEYDGEGNQIKRIPLLEDGSNDPDGIVRTFMYGHRNRLLRVDDWNRDPRTPDLEVILVQSISYTYDVVGRRIARSVVGEQLLKQDRFVFNGDNVWTDFEISGNEVVRYLFGNGVDQNMGRFKEDEAYVWYLGDNLGTIRDWADTKSMLIAHSAFGAFGDPLGTPSTTLNDRFGFTGREYNPESGLYFYRARFYNSGAGRFLEPDPLGYTYPEINLYRYVGNSPANGIDPTGEVSISEAALGIAFIAFVGFVVRAAATNEGPTECGGLPLPAGIVIRNIFCPLLNSLNSSNDAIQQAGS